MGTVRQEHVDELTNTLVKAVAKMQKASVQPDKRDPGSNRQTVTIHAVASDLQPGDGIVDSMGLKVPHLAGTVAPAMRVAFEKAGTKVDVNGGVGMKEVHNLVVTGQGIKDALPHMDEELLRAAAVEALHAQMKPKPKAGVAHTSKIDGLLQGGGKSHQPDSDHIQQRGGDRPKQ